MSVLQFRSQDQVTAMRDQQAQTYADNARAMAENYQQDAVVDNLAAHVRHDWQIAKEVKQPISTRLIDCLQRRKGMYSPNKLAELEMTNGSTIYMQLTGAKCRSAKAYLLDLYTPSGDRPFAVEPSPVAELPPEIKRKMMFEAISVLKQSVVDEHSAMAILEKHKDRLLEELKMEAEERAEKMTDQIVDLLVEARWRVEFDKFLDDLVTYPAAIMKGPVFTNRQRVKWVEAQGGYKPQREVHITPEVRRVSPFDSYPSPAITDCFDGHWHIEHRRFSFDELSRMRGAPGYNRQAIERVLLDYRDQGLTEWLWTEEEHARLTTGHSSVYGKRETIDALEWSGTMSGQMLINWGMAEGSVPDRFAEYPVSVMVIGNYAIRALINPDPAGRPDYFKACWENVPGSFWGNSLPEVMADCQDMCNGAGRSLANNLGIASGPQVWVDTSRVADGADVQNIFPWKIWYMKNNPHAPSQRDPIGFWQPTSNSRELMEVYERFSKYADEITGMPAFAYGSDSGAGAAKTASGLSMLLNAASKTIKAVVHNIDIGIIEPITTKFYNYIMLTHPDNSIKGDAVCVSRGSERLIHREAAQARAQELLAITNNPLDAQIIGQDGRLELLDQVMSTGDMPADRILPSREELAARNELAMQMQQMKDQAGGVQVAAQ